MLRVCTDLSHYTGYKFTIGEATAGGPVGLPHSLIQTPKVIIAVGYQAFSEQYM